MLILSILLLISINGSSDGSCGSFRNGSAISDCSLDLVMVSTFLPALFIVSAPVSVSDYRQSVARLTLASSVAPAVSAIGLTFATGVSLTAATHSPLPFPVPSPLPAQFEDSTSLRTGDNSQTVNQLESSSKNLLESAIFNEFEGQNLQMASFESAAPNNNESFSDVLINNLEINANDINYNNNNNSNNQSSSNEAATWSLLLSALFYKLDSFDVNWSNFILAIILVMLMLTTAVGNLFVIVAILIERNLRTIGNYLVLSLAIADLLVACLVMPLAGIYQILERWTLGVLLCDIWTSADVFCCTGEWYMGDSRGSRKLCLDIISLLHF